MKLLYVSTHQIHNLTPLYRALAKRKEIEFKSIYWQNISTNHHDIEFNKTINFEVDPFSGHDYHCLFNDKKDVYNFNFLTQLKVIPRLIKLIFTEKFDVLFLFSVSGNSPNLVEAIKIAKKIGVKTVSFTGFNGGKLSKMSDFNINFPIANFGIAEDCHISIMHYLSQYLRNINIKNKDFKKINF